MGGQNGNGAGRGTIGTRLAFQGNYISRLNWSACIVLIGYLLFVGLSPSAQMQVTDKKTEKTAEVVLADTKKQEQPEPVVAEPEPQPEPVPVEQKAEIIDTAAQNSQVQQVVLTDCEQLALELQKYDWDSRLMLAIATAESSCRSNAVGDGSLAYYQNGRKYGYSVGFFQIRILPGREHCDTFDIATNVACAYKIYQGQGLTAWSVYSNGMYAKYL